MYNYSFKYLIKFTLSISLSFLLLNSFLFAQKINGYVFFDTNNNSVFDSGEQGLEGVLVSNQRDVVKTDSNGFFQLKLIEGNFIFVTKPESYQFNLDKYNNPEFYFLYKTKNSKEEFKYPTAEPIPEIPEVLYFPLYENKGETEHSSLLLGDPQMKSDKKLNYYVEGIIPFLGSKDADFYVVLGDIAHNKLDILPKEKSATATLGIPGYRVLGNHDLNFKSSGNKNAQETFKNVYGPEYYSFDYGNVHYIVLNSVIYKGWWAELKAPGNYYGGLTPQQLNWLNNDLINVPSGKTIIIFSHIPLSEISVTPESMRGLYKALTKHKRILTVSGHLHSVIAYDYTAAQGWKNSTEFEGLVAGAVCGSWWSGPLDINNIPVSTCMDGSPKGFFQLNVKDKDYNYTFNPINYPSDYQLKTYVIEDEIWVNWFVGKSTDSVWLYLDDSKEQILLKNFTGKDPYMVLRFEARKHLDKHIKGVTKTSHLWKTKIPEGLEPGYHSLRIVAKDSKGKFFEGFKTFKIEVQD